jgi:hypothetical protein
MTVIESAGWSIDLDIVSVIETSALCKVDVLGAKGW